MGFMYPRFSVAVLALSPVSAQGFNSAALTISESLGAAIALAITALVSSAAGAGMFTADFAVTFAIADRRPAAREPGQAPGRRHPRLADLCDCHICDSHIPARACA